MKCLLVFFSFYVLNAFPQGKTDKYIRELNNSQFVIIHPQKANFKVKDYPSLKLIRTGKSISTKLIDALNDSTKTIMAHYVLCHVYLGQVSFAGPKHTVDHDHPLNKYYLGEEYGEGLLITEEELENKYKVYVTIRDREKVIAYWKKKIAN
jgi:hypothetical protein